MQRWHTIFEKHTLARIDTRIGRKGVDLGPLEFVTGREIDRKRACRKGPREKEFRNITNRKERKSSIRTVNDGWKEEDKVHKKKLRYE